MLALACFDHIKAHISDANGSPPASPLAVPHCTTRVLVYNNSARGVVSIAACSVEELEVEIKSNP